MNVIVDHNDRCVWTNCSCVARGMCISPNPLGITVNAAIVRIWLVQKSNKRRPRASKRSSSCQPTLTGSELRMLRIQCLCLTLRARVVKHATCMYRYSSTLQQICITRAYCPFGTKIRQCVVTMTGKERHQCIHCWLSLDIASFDVSILMSLSQSATCQNTMML